MSGTAALADAFFLGTKLYQKKFSELCAPLANYLGATHAIYINIDKYGRAFSICTHETWVERFLEERYYQLDPLMVHPDNIHNGFSFDNASEDEAFKSTMLYDAVVKFNWCNSFAYIEKMSNGGYFGFDFGTTKDNYYMVNRLINEARVIKNLIRNLNTQLMAITLDLQEERMDFAALKGEVFYTQKGLVFNEEYKIKNKIQSLHNLGIVIDHDSKDFLNKAFLAPQEINCLRIYLRTHSLQKVSKDMGLAITTATSYMENIKKKLGCRNKHELFEKAEVLESLGQI